MGSAEDPIEVAAELICVELHPAKLRTSYVRDISCAYRAEEIVYVLQALSTGMTALFVGLLTNYLYDKFKRKEYDIQKKTRLKKLITKQLAQIKRLEALVKKEKDRTSRKQAQVALEFHKDIILKIKSRDSSIEMRLEKTIRLLETKGKKEVLRRVNKYDERP